MKTYRFSSFGLKKLRRRFLQKAGLLTALVMGGLFLVFSYQSQQAQAGSYWFMVALLFLIGGNLVIGFARSLKKQEAALKAIRLVVDDEFVALQQADTPEVRIARAEVTALKETSAGLCVLTADPLRSLLIPSVLDEADLQEIKASLATWMPIQAESPANRRKSRVFSAAVVVFILAAFAVLFFSLSVWLVFIAGASLLAYWGYSIWTFSRVQGVSAAYRRNLVVVFVLSFLIWIAKLCLLFFLFLFAPYP
jgi:hypothetical protein